MWVCQSDSNCCKSLPVIRGKWKHVGQSLQINAGLGRQNLRRGDNIMTLRNRRPIHSMTHSRE